MKVRRAQTGSIPLSELDDAGQNDQGAQTDVESLDKVIGAKQCRNPVGIHAHDQIITDQAQHQRKCQNIKAAPDRHLLLQPLFVAAVSLPVPVDEFAEAGLGLIGVIFELQGIEQISKADTIQNQQTDTIAGEKKRYIEPDFLSMKILMQPRKDMGSSQK